MVLIRSSQIYVFFYSSVLKNTTKKKSGPDTASLVYAGGSVAASALVSVHSTRRKTVLYLCIPIYYNIIKRYVFESAFDK